MAKRIADIDWWQMKHDYIVGEESLRALAERYQVSAAAVMQRSAREHWAGERSEYKKSLSAHIKQTAEIAAIVNEMERIKRVGRAADRILERLEKGIEQVDQYYVNSKVQVQEREYEGEKLIRQVTDTREEREVREGIVDAASLRQFASALKDIRDIYRVDGEDGDEDSGVIVLSAVPEESS